MNISAHKGKIIFLSALSLVVLGSSFFYTSVMGEEKNTTHTYPIPQKEKIEIQKTKEMSIKVEDKDSVSTQETWQTWQTLPNWTFDVDRGNIPMIADVKALHPYMAQLATKLLEECEKKGIEVRIVETYRTRTKQAEYYGMGSGYTSSSAGKSKHQFGLAIDVVPMQNGKAAWENKKLFNQIGEIGEKLGFRWGGRWKSPYDPGHFEWTGGLKTDDLIAGKKPQVPIQEKEKFVDLSQQIQQLEENWEKIEAHQKETYAQK